jgi:hypothetical protein
MRDLQVLRWRKYGKDRLYVNDQAGQRVGWVDLLTGQVTIEKPEQADAFHAVVAAHQTGKPTQVADPAVSIEQPRQSVPSPRPSEEPAWVDLADNRPGQVVRELAEGNLSR